QSRVLLALSFARFHACLEAGIRRLVLGFLLFLPILVIRVGDLALHLLVLSLLLLLPGFVLSLLRLSPLFIGAAVSTRAQDCERSIGITTSLLDDEVAVGIAHTTSVNRIVVRAPAYLIPGTVFACVDVDASRGSRAAEDDVPDWIGGTCVDARTPIGNRIRAGDNLRAHRRRSCDASVRKRDGERLHREILRWIRSTSTAVAR